MTDELAARRKQRDPRAASLATIHDDLGIARGMIVEATAEAQAIGEDRIADELDMAHAHVERARRMTEERAR